MSEQFKHLFKPIKINNVTIPNRIMMAAHVTHFYPPPLAPDETYSNYLEARAKGGVGLIVACPNFPSWVSTRPFQTAFANESIIPVLSKLADTIHQHGTKLFGQLTHPGSIISSRIIGGGSTLSASGVRRTVPFVAEDQEVPHEIEEDHIKRVVEEFGAAALRLKKAGYDGAELGGQAGLLHGSFLSPVYNKRTDQYGGSLENRMRFILETLDSIRAAVGSDFVVGVRYGGDDFAEGGTTLEDAKEIARMLEASGNADYLFSCAGLGGGQHIPSMYYPLAPFTYISAGIKEEVSLPIVTVGRINDPILAEDVLANHQADMVAMVRALIADPEMPNKAREGRLDDIRKCIGCNEGCVKRPWASLPMSCAVNADVGREKVSAIMPAEVKKKVMVIGGGAAGLEAARVASLRGHSVSLYEKEDVLAKDLILAAKAPCRQGWDDARRFLTYQVNALGVDIHLNSEVIPEMVEESNYDAVVVATGTLPHIPDIPGSDGPNAVEMKAVLEEKAEVGENVVVVAIQQHMHGLQMADYLTEQGKTVEVLTSGAFAGDRLDGNSLEDVYRRLFMKNVKFTPLTGIKEIQGNTVKTYNILTYQENEINGVDTVVFCTDGIPNDSLYNALKGKVKELYQIGQCVSPRELLDSVHDGSFVGRQL